jgi:hypothetical protein
MRSLLVRLLSGLHGLLAGSLHCLHRHLGLLGCLLCCHCACVLRANKGGGKR